MVQTYNSLLDMMNELCVEIGQEMDADNPYIRRNLGGMSLTIQAYLLAGYEGEPCAYGIQSEVLPTGWFEAIHEEVSKIYKDGKHVATMTLCARGGAYSATLWVAETTEPGTQHPKLNLFADNLQPYWRPRTRQ